MDKFPWWNETQRKLADEVEAFADQYFPDSEEAAWKRQTPWKVLNAVKEKGWFGALIPKKYGGLREELAITGACIVNEGISRLGVVGTIYGGSMFGGAHQIETFGTEEQRGKMAASHGVRRKNRSDLHHRATCGFGRRRGDGSPARRRRVHHHR